MTRRKRSYDQFEADDSISAVVARLKDENNIVAHSPSTPNGQATHHENGDAVASENENEWQVVQHGNKRRKKQQSEDKKRNNNYPSIEHSAHARLQTFVKIGDLQNLALYLLADGTAPQWCSIRHHNHVRKVVVVMAPGLELDMFSGKISLSADSRVKDGHDSGEQVARTGSDDDRDSSATQSTSATSFIKDRGLHISPDDYYPVKLVRERIAEALQPLSNMFTHIWPIKTPAHDRMARMHSPLAAFLTAPVQKAKEEKNVKGPQFPPEGRNWQNRRTPITEMLATTEELVDEGYVLHPARYRDAEVEAIERARRVTDHTSTEDGWIDVQDIPSLASGTASEDDIEQGSVTVGRKILAIDCEMCITSPAGVSPQVFSLTRLSVVNWDGDVVLDTFVKPATPITDYLTPYSGITASMLENVTTTLQDAQAKLTQIITPQTILIGHSLNSDLQALKITHPFIVDTALLFPHPRGPPMKSSLKWLAQKYLSREIQKGHGSSGHDSIEDARACLDLVKQKCEKGKAWGTPEAHSESIFKRLGRSVRPKRDKSNPVGDDEHRIGAVVDWGDVSRGYGNSATVAINCENDDEVIAGVQRGLRGDDDDSLVPRGGCDLIWARLRNLEARRGWWNRSKLVDADALRASTVQATSSAPLVDVTAQTVQHLQRLYDSLPPCTAFIVYSGSGDPRELQEMHDLQRRFKEEYRVKKWDELSVRWTDVEEQRLRKACERARMGCGFVTVK